MNVVTSREKRARAGSGLKALAVGDSEREVVKPCVLALAPPLPALQGKAGIPWGWS